MKDKVLIACILMHSVTSLNAENRPNIFQAAREGNVAIIQQHLDNNENCSIKDEQGNNPLHIAAENGQDEAVKALTSYYDNCGVLYWIWSCFSGPTLPNIDETNNYGNTPLHIATQKGHISTVDTLLKKKARMDIVNQQQLSAAFTALKKDNPELLRAFVYNGLDPRTPTKNGTLMIHFAVENKKNNVVAYFAEHNPELLTQPGHNGIQPIHVAAKSNNTQILPLLLHNNIDINSTDAYGNTSAHYSAQYGTQEIMKELITHCADIKKRNNNGEDVPTVAIKYQKNNISQLLMNSIGNNINEQDKHGRTYAMNAALSGNNTILKTLLQQNADITLSDKNKKNILHLIGNTNNYEAAQLVLQKNKQLLTNTDADGNQPLCDAISAGNIPMVELYLAHGALLFARNHKGETPIFFAIKNNRAHVLEALKKYNLDITITNNSGEGLVHYAAFFDATDTLKVLKKHGASFSQRTAQGDTAVHSAAKNNSLNALRYFQSIGEHFDYTNNTGHTPFIAAALDGKLASTQFLFSEKSFRNNEVDFLLNSLSRSRTYDQKKVYDFIKAQQDEYIAECRKIRNEYITITNMINDNHRSIVTVTERNGFFGAIQYWAYQPTRPKNKSVEEIYRMTKEERTALYNHYIECKSEELNNKTKIESQLAALRAEEERLRAAQVAAERARAEERERSAMRERAATERARIQERDRLNELKRAEERREQERQARHNNALEGMHAPSAPVGMRPSAPAQEPLIVIDMQPSAPLFEPEYNHAPQHSAECCICFEETNLVSLPCEKCKIGSARICKSCIPTLRGKCPTCRGNLTPQQPIIEKGECCICLEEKVVKPLPCEKCKIGSARICVSCTQLLNGKCPTCRGKTT